MLLRNKYDPSSYLGRTETFARAIADGIANLIAISPLWHRRGHDPSQSVSQQDLLQGPERGAGRFEGRAPDLQLRFGLGACITHIMSTISV